MTVYLYSQESEAQEWQPAVDIYKTAYGWILKFDLAGVRLEDVHVHIATRAVTIEGVRRDSLMEEAGCRHYCMEISYSRFHRAIELPDDLRAAKFRLDYRDGILYVRIQLKESE